MNSLKIGAVVLSRFSSNRLPGKALRLIYGKPVLQFIIERLSVVLSKSEIVIATSTDESDNAIEELCNSLGVSCYRGSLSNVASRFYQACIQMDWDYGIRINGDNIFVDTDTLKAMTSLGKSGCYDFITNVTNRTFPKGMSIEIIRITVYGAILPRICSSNYHSEHVTSLLYESGTIDVSKIFHFYNTTNPEAAGIQLALDTPDDLERTQLIIGHFLNDHTTYNLPDIIKIIKELSKTTDK